MLSNSTDSGHLVLFLTSMGMSDSNVLFFHVKYLPIPILLSIFIWNVFFLIIYFNWRLITMLWWVLPYIDRNQPWVYMCLPSWTHLPPHPMSGLSQCTGPERPISCIKLELVIYFTYGNIHVSMLFSQISHPRLLPQSPKVCSLYLYLFCCFAYRVIITIFLNFIYMC